MKQKFLALKKDDISYYAYKSLRSADYFLPNVNKAQYAVTRITARSKPTM